MKRDLNLIRKILLTIEEHTEDSAIYNLSIEGYNPEQIAYQIYLIHGAELVEGEIQFGNGTVNPCGYHIWRMTWAGHDFLDACRNEGRWAQAKGIFSKMDGVPFDVLKGILVQIATATATKMITGG